MIRIKGGGDPLARVRLGGRPEVSFHTVRQALGVTKPVTKGRPKRYETSAERQKAYRERRKANGKARAS